MKKLLILNHVKDNPVPCYIGGREHSNAIDLYTAEDVTIKPGEFKIIDMGVSIKVPEGYKADLKPRSSTFKKFGIIQTNSVGLIDSSYSGKEDRIGMPVFAPITSDDLTNAFIDFVARVCSDDANTAGKTTNELIQSVVPIATREIFIPKGTRLCQLEILPLSDVDVVEEVEIENWEFDDRGGFGSTGV